MFGKNIEIICYQNGVWQMILKYVAIKEAAGDVGD
jgi:hypothetical protein